MNQSVAQGQPTTLARLTTQRVLLLLRLPIAP
jgi:hypothetical protein